MNFLHRLALPALAVLLSFALSPSRSYADSLLTASGTGAIVLDGANSAQGGFTPNTITLDPIGSLNLAGMSQFTEGYTFNSGYDGIGGPLPFNFSETMVVGGVSGVYNFSGTFLVSPTTDPDTFTLDAALPLQVDGYTISNESLTFLDNPPYPGGVKSGAITFDVAASTPEPSSLLLLGSGMIGIVGIARRRWAL